VYPPAAALARLPRLSVALVVLQLVTVKQANPKVYRRKSKGSLKFFSASGRGMIWPDALAAHAILCANASAAEHIWMAARELPRVDEAANTSLQND